MTSRFRTVSQDTCSLHHTRGISRGLAIGVQFHFHSARLPRGVIPKSRVFTNGTRDLRGHTADEVHTDSLPHRFVVDLLSCKSTGWVLRFALVVGAYILKITGANMRRAVCATLFLIALFAAVPGFAQNPNYDVGPVWRVVYYKLKPGQGEAFWKDFRENLKPSYEALKKEGLFSEYKVWTNATTDGPQDWDIALGYMTPTGGGIDQLETGAATILAKHYGSREAMLEAGKKRNEIRE